MAEDGFRVLFKYMDKEHQSLSNLESDMLRSTMIQDEEIRRLAEIIRDATPADEPLIYSSSGAVGPDESGSNPSSDLGCVLQ